MPLFSTPYLLFFVSLFLPSVVRAPCFSRSRPLPRGPIQPLLLCSYYQAHGSRPNRKLGIYALLQIDLLYLILTPSRRPLLPQLSLEGVDAFARTLFFSFLIDRFPPGYRPRARFLLSFFRFQRNSSLLAVGRSPGSIDLFEITLPFHSLFRGFSLRSLLFNPSLRLYRCWGSSQIRGGTNEVRDVL